MVCDHSVIFRAGWWYLKVAESRCSPLRGGRVHLSLSCWLLSAYSGSAACQLAPAESQKFPAWLAAADWGWHGPLCPLSGLCFLGRSHPGRDSCWQVRGWHPGILSRPPIMNRAPFLMALISEPSVTGWIPRAEPDRWKVPFEGDWWYSPSKSPPLKDDTGVTFQRSGSPRAAFHLFQGSPLWHSALVDHWETAGYDQTKEPEALLFHPALPVRPSQNSLSASHSWWLSP